MNTAFLEATDLRKSYGKHAALDGVSFLVERGEIFGLLGPNGAGKTTLLSILAGLLDADAGHVSLQGEPFSTRSRERRNLVGIATQDLALYPELTGRENLTFFGKIYAMRGADLKLRVNELLAAVGLSERADDRAGTYSGGMKRRLNLAIAVVHRPQLLLLDEPTTGVDPQSRNHIFDLVRSQNAAGLTVIYTSHYMEEVQALCPRIAILDRGQMQACDTLPNLLQRLDSVVKLTLPNVPEELLANLKQLPQVRAVNVLPSGVEVYTAHLAPLLPKIVWACDRAGLQPTAMEVEQPTLERVFLSLTGRALRD